MIRESRPVDTLITANLPEVSEIHFIRGIKPARSPLGKSQPKRFQPRNAEVRNDE